ncbi:hypothetical protein E6W36_03830 [Hankyongella ginsenosidimutans]|uniref:Uncharacterized protein n=1 Tax=Hankyongella ginsenosidimutans TaxID=1763828 RepID=A0A4D7C5U2_9SPHN|nr:hypothetical protein E6W36_03830 [Hankyongella ginsenosidimutans]
MPGVPPVRPVAIILSENRHARVLAALSLACALAALGRTVIVFAHGASVTVLRQDACWPEDETLAARGCATVPELLFSTQELGVTFMACESGLHATCTPSSALHGFVTTGGLLGLFQVQPGAEIVPF